MGCQVWRLPVNSILRPKLINKLVRGPCAVKAEPALEILATCRRRRGHGFLVEGEPKKLGQVGCGGCGTSPAQQGVRCASPCTGRRLRRREERRGRRACRRGTFSGQWIAGRRAVGNSPYADAVHERSRSAGSRATHEAFRP